MKNALADVLTALGDRVAPVSLAQERTLPVATEFAELFIDDGLVRGRVLSCTGDAASTVTFGLIAEAVQAGSWVVVIDVPTIGLDAVSELGVPLERIVAVRTDIDEHTNRVDWADVVAAAADGFDVVVTRVPVDVRPATVRKVATRLQQRGVVMLVLGDPGPVMCDGVIDSDRQVWSGLGAGWGHLQQRSVDVVVSGRRLPGRRCRTLTFPSVASSHGVPERGSGSARGSGPQGVPECVHDPVELSPAS